MELDIELSYFLKLLLQYFAPKLGYIEVFEQIQIKEMLSQNIQINELLIYSEAFLPSEASIQMLLQYLK